MNWYKNLFKFATIRYMYHGTSINNLSSILSEGLNTQHGTVWDQTYQNTDQTRSTESYGGIYFTDNLRTALMAGFTAGEKNKVATDKSAIVIAQIEDKTPSVLMDEDQLRSPYFAIYQVAGEPDHAGNLAEWITKGFPNIEQAVEYHLDNLLNRNAIEDKRFLEGLKPHVPELLKSFAIQHLAIALEKKDWGTSTLLHYYPELGNLPDMATAIQNYRNVFGLFMQKANRLTSFMEDGFQNNMRITEPISYGGRNKIVLVSTFNRENRKSDYNYVIEIIYMSNDNVLQQYISDINIKYSNSFYMTYNDNIIYDNKKEREGAIV